MTSTTNQERASPRLAASMPVSERQSLLSAGSRSLDTTLRQKIHRDAAELVRQVRASGQHSLMERFLTEYGLSTTEGVGLMCLAEALLRVPDADTIDELIRDKIEPSNWGAHLGRSSSSLVNASTWALMLTGHLLDDDATPGPVAALRGLIRRLGEPVVRVAVGQAMKTLGQQFVLGQDIAEAQRRGHSMRKLGFTYSFDMLGEAARTAADAKRYGQAYADALRALSPDCGPDIRSNPGISVKLSALHPRYEFAQRDRVMAELVPSTLALAQLAKAGNMGLNIDAEEADRLDLSLDVIEAVLADSSLTGWDGFGVVVQAYGLRAPAVIDWLHALAMRLDRRIMVRLVKGAYWDSEIKRAQELGLDGFPVYTAKPHTDISYLLCAEKMLAATDRIYPQFATHNAHSCAAILALASDRNAFEFQRLHGMGEALHQIVKSASGTRCRIYAPVGAHRDLLAYLVRRLLENGANSSFVNQIANDHISPEQIAADPFDALSIEASPRVSAIRMPPDLFAPSRRNSRGWDLTDPRQVEDIDHARDAFRHHQWRCAPMLSEFVTAGQVNAQPSAIQRPTNPIQWRTNPANRSDRIGEVIDASEAEIDAAFEIAGRHWPAWSQQPTARRAETLRRAADLFEANSGELFALCTREAGKTLKDCIAELREAVDFLRYYASEAERLDALAPLHGRGIFVCVSPWNFPLAIFCGQVAAALISGNAVLAKPAEQTPLVAARAVQYFHDAGVPRAVLQLLPGDGPRVGARLTSDPRIAGVVFTGSSEVARLIHAAIAEHASADTMLIAETGGLNAMIVDSTALPEQVVRDVVASAFQSSGQRCSALRVLYVQSGIEQRLLEMLAGAIDELRIGDPWSLATDIGPVIDAGASSHIRDYCDAAGREGRLIKSLPIPAGAASAGHYVAPCVLRVDSIADMASEVFGPVLHVARFEADQLEAVVDEINDRGYGLTFGLHTRIDDRVQRVTERIRVGNVYVNRNQIGAVVGSQPFGGEGLSGTGPKAGGPHYLRRFARSDWFARSVDLGSNADRGTPVLPTSVLPTSVMSTTAQHATAQISCARIGAALDSMAANVAETIAWAKRTDRARLIRGVLLQAGLFDSLALQALNASLTLIGNDDLSAATQALPGPTGESNRLSLHPRKIALCLGPQPIQALAQAVQILIAGGQALIVCDLTPPRSDAIAIPAAHASQATPTTQARPAMHATQAALAALATAGAPIRMIAGSLDPAVLRSAPAIGVVAYAIDESSEAKAVARALRRALAARAGELIGLVTEPIAPLQYLIERHLCIDTTAAGGNASLLADA